MLSSKERQRTIIRAHIAEVCLLYLLAKTLVSTFLVQHDEDFGRAARFPYCYNICVLFYLFCDLLLVISVKLKEMFQ